MGIPVWLAIWCGWVAAVLFTPSQIVERFLIEPLLPPDMAGLSQQELQIVFHAGVLHVRFWGIVFALLYLLLRAVTAKVRRGERA